LRSSNIGASGAYLAAGRTFTFCGWPLITICRLHSESCIARWGTPWVALLVQAVIGAIFIFLGQAGNVRQGGYDVLVSMA